jgi:SRSO17 transposase
VKQQYIGNLGKIENGIVAVTAYGLLEGMTFPLIFEVYKPKERLREGQPYLSKPKLAVEMIRYLPKIGLRFKLVLADSLYGESHSTFINVLNKLFLGVAWYTGERPEAILSVDVNHIYENPAQRQPRDTIIYPGVNRKDNKTREVPTH